jgi:hypothetical protein
MDHVGGINIVDADVENNVPRFERGDLFEPVFEVENMPGAGLSVDSRIGDPYGKAILPEPTFHHLLPGPAIVDVFLIGSAAAYRNDVDELGLVKDGASPETETVPGVFAVSRSDLYNPLRSYLRSKFLRILIFDKGSLGRNQSPKKSSSSRSPPRMNRKFNISTLNSLEIDLIMYVKGVTDNMFNNLFQLQFTLFRKTWLDIAEFGFFSVRVGIIVWVEL